MLSATRYLSCTLMNGRIQISYTGTLGDAVPSYWSREDVATRMDDKVDCVIHTRADLDAAQAESTSRYIPFRMVFVADSPHAYKETPGRLHVGVVIRDRRMVVSIRDEGKRVAIPHIPIELSERGSGYGLFVIGQVVDEVACRGTTA